MALMERVATLLRANINDLIDRAEDPEKMLKQLVLDMRNQLLQLKTQVAIAIADQHLLQKKESEQSDLVRNWRRKAELAVSKADDALARAALERVLTHENLRDAFEQQVTEATAEADTLRSSYTKLQGKLAETEGQCELLIAEHRRARTAGRAQAAKVAALNGGAVNSRAETLGRYKARVHAVEADNFAARELEPGDSLDDRLMKLERDEQVERLLEELKGKRMLSAG
jgi:phage shock protein A